MKKTWLGYALIAVLAVGCTEDPQYIGPPAGTSFAIEFNGTAPPPMVVTLPFRIETPTEAMERAALATDLMIAVDQVPFVRLDDVDLSIEWSVKNLTACDSSISFAINGGNPYFSYDPIVLQPDPDEPQPPPLLGRSAPIAIAPNAVVTGVFREDQILEASIDLELITRGNYNPFRAGLEVNKDMDTVEIYTMAVLPTPQMPNPPAPTGTGVFLPRAVWALMTSFSMAFTADTIDCGMAAHLVFEFAFRARDHRGVVHDRGLDAPAGELTVYAPAVYGAPPPPP